MNSGKKLFAQIMAFVPWTRFAPEPCRAMATLSDARPQLYRAIPGHSVCAFNVL